VALNGGVDVESFTPTQGPYIDIVRELLIHGVPARRSNEVDGNWELYGPDRTYLVTLDFTTPFAGLLSSWPPDRPPRTIILEESE
jgi:hypothetical protein